MGNFWPHAKILGGGSAINSMIYTRGNPRDFNTWAEAGNPTWNWNNVLEYFKKLENNRSPIIAADTKYHSTEGPLNIETTPIVDPVIKILPNGLTEMGYERLVDINSNKHLGVTYPSQTTSYHGKRWRTAKAFLIPANKSLKFAYYQTCSSHNT